MRVRLGVAGFVGAKPHPMGPTLSPPSKGNVTDSGWDWPVPRQRGRQDPAVWVGLGLALWLLICVAAAATDWGGPIGAKIFGLYYDLPVGPILYYLCWRIASHPDTQSHARRGWRLLGVAYLTYWIGNCIWNVYEGVLEIKPFPSIADVFFLAFYPLALWALLRLSGSIPSNLDQAKFFADCACAGLSVVGVLWYLGLRYVEIDVEHGQTGALVSLAYPTADAMLMIAVVSAFLKRQYSRIGPALALIAGSVAALMAADLSFLIPAIEDTYSSGGLTDGLQQVSYGLAACAAVMQLWSRPRVAAFVARPQGYRFQIFPYLAAALVYGLLLWEVRGQWSTATGVLCIIAVGTTALVITRQILAAKEIAELSLATAMLSAEARYKSLVRNSSDIVLVLDQGYRIIFATPSITHLFGIEPDAAIGRSVSELVHPDNALDAQTFCRDVVVNAERVGPVEWRLATYGEQDRFVEVLGSNLIADPSVSGLVLNLRDVTERRRLEEELKKLAFTDTLTLLANRNLFNEKLSSALAGIVPGKSVPVLIFVDLDNFKKINDTLGHGAGDKVLAIAAQRLIRATRTSDIVARLGGDEFAVLVADESSDIYVKSLADRFLDLLSTPFHLEGRRLNLSASIGITRGEQGLTPQEFMRNADLAMYRAKAQGKNRYALYETDMYDHLLHAVDLETGMQAGLEKGEFVPYFQPIIDLQTREIVGIEALARWHHPTQGTLLPATFIHIAEDCNLINRLGREVLFTTCRYVAQSLKSSSPARLRHVAVNVSGHQLQHLGLVDEVRAALVTHGLDPGILILEITESVLIHNVDLAIEQLTRLKSLGVKIALDDFGTGYSSLSHLHQFPIDIIKIDRSFVKSMNNNEGSSLVGAIVGLATMLNLVVVAEGIEEIEQFEQLRQMSCQFGQGHYFGMPAAPENTYRLLANTA